VVEVGMGGRFDATNVLEPEALAACGIAALGLDHERFLLAPEEGVPKEPMARIAFEKAGIAKRGVPLVTLHHTYPPEAQAAVAAVAAQVGAALLESFTNCYQFNGHSAFLRDDYSEVPLVSSLSGEHQALNLCLAIEMLMTQSKLVVSEAAILIGARTARWPARMQRLGEGPLTALVSQPIWLDGGHNPSAGAAIAAHFDGPLHLVIGMIEGKDPRALIDPLTDCIRSLKVVPVPGHECHPAEAFGPDARAASDVADALLGIAGDDYPILIAGSLYLAGEVLRLNDELPD
jgi:dihydrofolate synthase/folylpolyglutamate synthase